MILVEAPLTEEERAKRCHKSGLAREPRIGASCIKAKSGQHATCVDALVRSNHVDPSGCKKRNLEPRSAVDYDYVALDLDREGLTQSGQRRESCAVADRENPWNRGQRTTDSWSHDADGCTRFRAAHPVTRDTRIMKNNIDDKSGRVQASHCVLAKDHFSVERALKATVGRYLRQRNPFTSQSRKEEKDNVIEPGTYDRLMSAGLVLECAELRTRKDKAHKARRNECRPHDLQHSDRCRIPCLRTES